MSLFNLPMEKKTKPVTVHPWAKTMKDYYADRIKRSHNSVRNVVYPRPKERIPNKKRKTFTIIGNRVSKEFIYCVNLTQGMHKYRWKHYATPIIRGCTGVEWPEIFRNLKVRYGNRAHCLKNQVAVLCDDQCIGGEEELKNMIEAKYSYHLALNYQKESQKHFISYLKSSGKPCVYMHIYNNENPIGSLIFMLYSDVVPLTCENFLRLCQLKRGGYSGTPVHRIVKEGWIQCGGFGLKNTDLNYENYIVPNDKRGVLGMANAGRGIDCSTQFYILLQPNEWLNLKFVAFGQLIEGEETLKKIEAVETYYEAPTSNIIIHSAGIVNLDCRDIRINKGALEYLEGHVEDLVTLGEMFYEILLERVWLEITLREIQRLQPPDDEGSEVLNEASKSTVDSESNFIEKNIKTTRKLVRIEDNEKQIKRQDLESPSVYSVDGNNDFDVDEYVYKPEEISYDQVTPSSVAKEERKFFVPWTDVPYPGEVDSNFDLKRMLQGNYCLESDLDPNQSKLEILRQNQNESFNVILNMIHSYSGVTPPSSSSDSIDTDSMDSDEKQEFEEYLRLTVGENVCMSGKTMETISRACHRSNPLVENGPTECFTDEDMRMMRMALYEFKMQQRKKVSINPMEMRWRQTDFLPADIVWSYSRYKEPGKEEDTDVKVTSSELNEPPKMRSIMKSVGEKQGDGDNETSNIHTSVSINQSVKTSDPHPIDRRQTGYYRPEDIPTSEELKEEKRIKDKTQTPTNSLKSSVKISSVPKESRIIPGRLSAYESRGPQSQIRPSVLIRLLEDVAGDDNKATPTLKTYEPLDFHKKEIKLAMSDSAITEHTFLRRDTILANGLKTSFQEPEKNIDRHIFVKRVPSRHHQTTANIKREMTSLRKDSIRSLQSERWKRRRPTMTVEQYQKMNEERMEEAKEK